MLLWAVIYIFNQHFMECQKSWAVYVYSVSVIKQKKLGILFKKKINPLAITSRSFHFSSQRSPYHRCFSTSSLSLPVVFPLYFGAAVGGGVGEARGIPNPRVNSYSDGIDTKAVEQRMRTTKFRFAADKAGRYFCIFPAYICIYVLFLIRLFYNCWQLLGTDCAFVAEF